MVLLPFRSVARAAAAASWVFYSLGQRWHLQKPSSSSSSSSSSAGVYRAMKLLSELRTPDGIMPQGLSPARTTVDPEIPWLSNFSSSSSAPFMIPSEIQKRLSRSSSSSSSSSSRFPLAAAVASSSWQQLDGREVWYGQTLPPWNDGLTIQDWWGSEDLALALFPVSYHPTHQNYTTPISPSSLGRWGAAILGPPARSTTKFSSSNTGSLTSTSWPTLTQLVRQKLQGRYGNQTHPVHCSRWSRFFLRRHRHRPPLPRAPLIEESLTTRIAWMRAVDACPHIPVQGNETAFSSLSTTVRPTTNTTPASTASLATTTPWEYAFCFRDYVNHEELLAMLCRRGTMENILVRPGELGRLFLSPPPLSSNSSSSSRFWWDSETGQLLPVECRLSERGYALGFIPLTIEWLGKFSSCPDPTASHVPEDAVPAHHNSSSVVVVAIQWDHTRLQFGWKRSWFPRWTCWEVDRPPAAEKLRVDPWIVHVRPPDSPPAGSDPAAPPEVLVFHRQGHGKLVYGHLNQE